MLWLGIIIAAALLVACLWVFDAFTHGPYATFFNHRCQRLAEQARLVGGPESKVVKVLGTPTWIWKYWSSIDTTGNPSAGAHFTVTYNYAPCPLAASGLFQVHCINGVVKAIELFDD
jgi:hypothetical protein